MPISITGLYNPFPMSYSQSRMTQTHLTLQALPMMHHQTALPPLPVTINGSYNQIPATYGQPQITGTEPTQPISPLLYQYNPQTHRFPALEMDSGLPMMKPVKYKTPDGNSQTAYAPITSQRNATFQYLPDTFVRP
jgi:hypothetical protein